jgi:hypothetical protein
MNMQVVCFPAPKHRQLQWLGSSMVLGSCGRVLWVGMQLVQHMSNQIIQEKTCSATTQDAVTRTSHPVTATHLAAGWVRSCGAAAGLVPGSSFK